VRALARHNIERSIHTGDNQIDAQWICRPYAALRQRLCGLQRLEGRDYVAKDGDRLEIRFNV
jgi:hypothetical protein